MFYVYCKRRELTSRRGWKHNRRARRDCGGRPSVSVDSLRVAAICLVLMGSISWLTRGGLRNREMPREVLCFRAFEILIRLRGLRWTLDF